LQKLQGAIQAAPAIAFDLALKTMAPEISDSIKAFEKIINHN
jgi:conjugative transfer pilus assembly protein TraH